MAQEDGLAIASKLIVPLGLAISVIAHLVFLGPALILAGGSPFNTPPADAITVDIVTSDELPEAADDKARPETASGENASTSASPPPAEQAAASPPRSPQPAPPRPDPRTTQSARAAPQAIVTPQSVLPPPPFAPPQAAQPESPQPAAPNEPGGMFGMPLTMPDGTVGGGHFDSQATDRAAIENDVVAAFRSHLKTCSKLPPGVAPDVTVVMRVYLKPDGTLAAGIADGNPQTIKADGVSRGAGPLSVNAGAALRKCQPYKMLPPDRYQEWKTLDITFTPQNF